MKTAVLTIGMRGSGKSTYCRRVKEADPSIHLLCRDDFFRQHFGTRTFDGYSRRGEWAVELFWRHARDVIRQYTGIFLIDYWTGYREDRWCIIQKLRQMGAERVIGLYFNTSLDTCANWFARREVALADEYGTPEYFRRRAYRDWDLFKENISDIFAEDGSLVNYEEIGDRERLGLFDLIALVSPEQLMLPEMPITMPISIY